MSEHDSLIERLREAVTVLDEPVHCVAIAVVVEQAAAALSSLAAEVASLRAERDEARRMTTPIANVTLSGDAEYWKQRAESAEARVLEVERDAKRYRHLVDRCSTHFAMTESQPAEWSIAWEFQQSAPNERFATFDSLIDRDIEATERQAKLDAELDAEDDARALLKERGDTALSVSDYSKGER